MKIKNHSSRSGVLLGFFLLLIIPISCKKINESMNVDKKLLPYGPYVPAALVASMETEIMEYTTSWQYQLQQNLNADLFSGYMMTPTPFKPQFNQTYAMVDGWNDYIWTVPANGVMNPWLEVAPTAKAKSPDIYAISLILKVLAMHRVTDCFGPIPYTHYGEGVNPPFDSQKDIYYAFFSELNEAIGILTPIETNTPAADAAWAKVDQSTFGGDYRKWVRLANSLRLRLALRISKVDAAKAKSEALAAISHPFGLMDVTDGPFGMNCPTHPLWTINGWGDIRMGASLESILVGYNDPRLAKYVLPATDPSPLIYGKYKGIRQGILLPKGQYSNFSMLNFTQTSPLIMMTAAESYFNKAEAVLNGWVSGDMQTLYEDGIKASFTQYGLAVPNSYLTDNVSVPSAYVDPKDSTNNIASTITIHPAWDGTHPLEQIITQKWIATYPNGQEAWSVFRASGYPKLFPVKINDNPSIAAGDFIKRIPYTTTLKNNPHYRDLLTNDVAGQKLWWNP